MRIKVVDQNELEKANSYFKGFDTGVFNTLNSIVNMRKTGQTLKQIYKVINETYKAQCEARNENNSKRN